MIFSLRRSVLNNNLQEFTSSFQNRSDHIKKMLQLKSVDEVINHSKIMKISTQRTLPLKVISNLMRYYPKELDIIKSPKSSVFIEEILSDVSSFSNQELLDTLQFLRISYSFFFLPLENRKLQNIQEATEKITFTLQTSTRLATSLLFELSRSGLTSQNILNNIEKQLKTVKTYKISELKQIMVSILTSSSMFQSNILPLIEKIAKDCLKFSPDAIEVLEFYVEYIQYQKRFEINTKSDLSKTILNYLKKQLNYSAIDQLYSAIGVSVQAGLVNTEIFEKCVLGLKEYLKSDNAHIPSFQLADFMINLNNIEAYDKEITHILREKIVNLAKIDKSGMNSLSRIGIYLCKSENHDKDLRLAIAPNQYDFNKLSSSIFR